MGSRIARGAYHQLHGLISPPNGERRSPLAVPLALALIAIAILALIPNLASAQTPDTQVTITSPGRVTEGTIHPDHAGNQQTTLEYKIKVDRNASADPLEFYIDWTADAPGSAATLDDAAGAKYVRDFRDVFDPQLAVGDTHRRTVTAVDRNTCPDTVGPFCGRIHVKFDQKQNSASTAEATLKIKITTDRYEEIDESFRLNFEIKSAGNDQKTQNIGRVRLKSGSSAHLQKTLATILDDDVTLPVIIVYPNHAHGRNGRGAEGNSGDGSEFGVSLNLIRVGEACKRRTTEDVIWEITDTSTATGSGPFPDYTTAATSGTIRLDMVGGDPDGAGDTGCSQTKKIVMKTVPDEFSEENEFVSISFRIKDTVFPSALLNTSVYARTAEEQPRTTAIVKPIIANDDPEAGVVVITPSVPAGSALPEGTSNDKTAGSKVDFTATVHRPPPAQRESANNLNWQLGWLFPLNENTANLRGDNEFSQASLADETRDVWAREPQVNNPAKRQYNPMNLTLGFAPNAAKSQRTLRMEVNPDDKVENAEKVTLRFTPGRGTIGGQKVSLPGGVDQLDFSYTIQDDDKPSGRILVEAPANGTEVTEGSRSADAGEIRLTLTAHRSLAEANGAQATAKKFRFTIDSASTASHAADFKVNSSHRRTGDVTFRFANGAVTASHDLVIGIEPDEVDEQRESIVLTLEALGSETFPDGDDADDKPEKSITYTYHIVDDDSPPWHVNVTAPKTVAEGTGASGGNTAQIIVTAYRTQAASNVGRPYNFRWEVVSGESEATTGGDLRDHTLAASGRLSVSFSPGRIRSREVALDLTTIPDFAFEPDEKVVIKLRIPQGDGLFHFGKDGNGNRITSMNVEITITDDDESTGTIVVTTSDPKEDSGDPLNFTVRGTRVNTSERRLDNGSVTWQLLDGNESTATRGVDYNATPSAESGSYNLSYNHKNDNRTPAHTFSMTVADDEIPEGNERVAVRFRKGNDGFHFPDADGDGYPEREMIVYGRIIDDEEGATRVSAQPGLNTTREGTDLTFEVSTNRDGVGTHTPPGGNLPVHTNPRSEGILYWELMPSQAVFSPTNEAAGYKPGEDFKFKSASSVSHHQATHTHTISQGRLSGKMHIVMPEGDITEEQVIKFSTRIDDLIESAETVILRLYLDADDAGDLKFPGGESEIFVSGAIVQDSSKVDVTVTVPDEVTIIEGRTAIVPLRLDRALKQGESAAVTLSTYHGTSSDACATGGVDNAIPEVDYVPVRNQRVLWGPGEQMKQVAFTTYNDALDNKDKCFQISWGDSQDGLKVDSGDNFLFTSGVTLKYTNVKIEDDDDPPELYAKQAFVTEPDDGATANLRFEVGLNTPTSNRVEINYALDTYNPGDANFPDVATAGSDFVASTAAGMLVFEPGDVRKYVDVQVQGDYTEEKNEYLGLKFTLQGSNTAVTFDGSSSLVTAGFITDNDKQLRLSVTLDDPRMQEGQDAVYRLNLSHPIENGLLVQASAKDAGATAGVDYAAGGWTFNVPAGETEGTIAIETIDDGASGEGTEKFSISITSIVLQGVSGQEEYRKLFGSAYDAAALRASIDVPTAEILDGPSVSLMPVYPMGQVEGMPLLFEARLNEPIARDLNITVKSNDSLFAPSDDFQPGPGYRPLEYEFAASSNASDRDYTALPESGLTVTIPQGETSAQFSLDTDEDSIDEWAERFIVYITDSHNQQIDEQLATGVIRDNDPRPQLSIADAPATTEGGDLNFKVTLSALSQKTITVHWHTEDDTAFALNGDYEAMQRQTLTFGNATINNPNHDNNSQTITIKTMDDDVNEATETIRVVLSDAPEAQSDRLTATGSITDNDTLVDVTIEDAAPVAEESGGSAEFTVRLNRAQSAPLTIQYSTVEGTSSDRFDTAHTGGGTRWGLEDFTPVTNASLTFAAGEMEKTISVPILDDDSGEGPEYFMVQLTGDTSKVRFQRDTARGYIEDTDALHIWLSDETQRYLREGIVEGSGGNPGDSIRTTVDTKFNLTLQRTQLPTDDPSYHRQINTLSCFYKKEDGDGYAEVHPEIYTHDYKLNISYNDAADVLFEARRYESNRSLQCHTRYEILWPLYQYWESGVWELTIPLAIPQDTRKEKDEVFTVQVEMFSGQDLLQRTALPDWANFHVSFTIVDDDSNKVSLDFASAADGTNEDDGLKHKTVQEGSDVMLRVSTTSAVAESQTVHIAARPETAEPGVDFKYAEPIRVVIPPGHSSVDVRLPIFDDREYEGAESFVVELVDESDGIAIHTPQKAVRVHIPEALPTLYVVPDVTVDEGRDATLTFRFDEPLRTATTVTWRILNADIPNPASAGVHYASPASRSVSVSAGETSATATLSTLDNGVADGDKIVGVVASASGLRDQYSHPDFVGHVSQITIRDTGRRSVQFAEPPQALGGPEGFAYDLPQPKVSVKPQGKLAFFSLSGDDAGVFFVHPFTGVVSAPVLHIADPKDADGDNTYEVTLHLTDEDGNTVAADISGVVGERPLHIEPQSITIAEKVVTIDGETTTTAPGSATLLVYPADGSIQEGEEIVITISGKNAGAKAPDENNPLAYTLQRTKGNPDDPEDTAGDTTELKYTYANRTLRHEVTVTAIDDEIQNPDLKRDGVIVITVKGGGYLETMKYEVPVSVTDDDQAAVLIEPTELTLIEREDASYTIVLASKPTGPVNVKLSGIENSYSIDVASGRDAEGKLVILPLDPTFTFTPANWNKPRTVLLHSKSTPKDFDFTITHTVSGADYGSVTADDVAVKVLNTDAAMSIVKTVKADEGGEVEFHFAFVHEENGAPADYELTWSTADDTKEGANQAIPGVDYTTVTDQTLIIKQGEGADVRDVNHDVINPIVLKVQTTQDLMDEDDETFVITLTTPDNLLTSDIPPKGKIVDDDDAPTVSVGDATAVTEGDDPNTPTDMTFPVTLSAPSSREITLDYTLSGTATAGDDYTDPATKTLTIKAGEPGGSIVIPVLGDTMAEDDETIIVTISNPANATLSTEEGATTAEGLITDDDDGPTLSIADATAVAEGNDPKVATDMTFTVTPSEVSGQAITVDYTLGGTATAGVDYTVPATQTLTIEAGAASGSIVIPVLGDTMDEPNETITVTLTNPTNATLSTTAGETDAEGTITDDDGPPTVSIANAAAVTEGNDPNAETDMTFTVTLSAVSGLDAEVSYTLGGTATAGDDYTDPATKTVEIAAGETSGSIVIPVLDDLLVEGNETIEVTLSAPTANAAVGSPSTGAGTITDDDAAPTKAALSIAPAKVGEGAGSTTVTVTATLDGTTTFATDKTVSVKVGKSGDSAASVTDYAAVGGFDITITAGKSSGEGTFTLTPTSDAIDEDDESLTVHATSAGLTVADASVVIVDDELVVAENVAAAPTFTFTVLLDEAFDADKTVTVSIGKDGDSATKGVDYTAVQSFDIAIKQGETSTFGQFTFAPIDDTLDEADETVSVYAELAGEEVSSSLVKITDDDDPPALSIADASAVLEGNDPATATNMTFAVTLSAASGRDVSVDYTLAGTATADADYTDPTPKTLLLAAGETTGEITIAILGDTIAEGDETIEVTLSAPTNATLSTTAGAITAEGAITDDDTAPTTAVLSVSPASVAEEDGATTITVTATLDGNVTFTEDTTVRVTIGKDGDSAVSDTDYTGVAAFDLTISAGALSGQQTFSLTPMQDTLDEDDESLTVHATATDLTIADAEITITDDDALPELTIADASVAEGDKASFTVTLTPASGRDVSFQWTTGDDTSDGANQATANTDYTAVTKALTATISAGDTSADIEVQTTEDTIAENAETFVVTLASPTNATLGSSATATGTITDDDTAPTTAALSVSPSSVGEAAGATTITVTATLAGAVTLNTDTTVRVTVGKDGDSAVSDTDYTGVAAFDLTISAGALSGEKTFSLTPTNDTLDEDNESLTIHATATGLTIADAAITITDDDATPELTIADASATEGDKASFTVTLTPASGRDVTFQWTTGDDGTDGANQATANTDYSAQTSAATLTIAAGNTSADIEVQTTEDNIAEGDETFVVTLSGPTNATLGASSSATGTITDDDTAPTTAALSVSPTSVAEAAGATTVTVTATLAGSVTLNTDTTVRVTVGKDGDSAVSDTDYTGVAAFDLTISAGEISGQQTFSLTPTNDTLDEDNESLTVHATADGITIDDAEVTITDDDAMPELTIADASVTEGDKATFTVALIPASGRDVSFQWTTGDDGADGASQATADTDYTAQTTAQTVTINAGDTSATVEVQTTEDTIAENDETFVVTLASPTNASLGSSSNATGTITDNDTAPTTAALSVSPSSVGEEDRRDHHHRNRHPRRQRNLHRGHHGTSHRRQGRRLRHLRHRLHRRSGVRSHHLRRRDKRQGDLLPHTHQRHARRGRRVAHRPRHRHRPRHLRRRDHHHRRRRHARTHHRRRLCHRGRQGNVHRYPHSRIRTQRHLPVDNRRRRSRRREPSNRRYRLHRPVHGPDSNHQRWHHLRRHRGADNRRHHRRGRRDLRRNPRITHQRHPRHIVHRHRHHHRRRYRPHHSGAERQPLLRRRGRRRDDGDGHRNACWIGNAQHRHHGSGHRWQGRRHRHLRHRLHRSSGVRSHHFRRRTQRQANLLPHTHRRHDRRRR